MAATFYHVTLDKNLSSIERNGIRPAIGERSFLAGESVKSIYLFNSIHDCENALMNWLGDAFDENDDIVVLEVELDIKPSDSFETITLSKISQCSIKNIFDESLIKFKKGTRQDRILKRCQSLSSSCKAESG